MEAIKNQFTKLQKLPRKKVYTMALVAVMLVGITSTALFLAQVQRTQNVRSFAEGTNLVVAKDGSGQYTTIQAAADAATPGSTVVIKAGTYNELVTIKNAGVANAYITFQAEPGAKVIVDGTDLIPVSATTGLFTLNNKSYIKIIGLTFTNSKSHGIYASRSNNVIIQNNEVANSQNGGILVGDATNITIDGNNVHNNNAAASGGNIDLAANEAISLYKVTTFEVMNNKVYDNYEEGIDPKSTTSNGSIHNNVVYGNNGPNIYIDGASNIEVYDNNVYDAKGATKAGIGLAVESGGSASNVKIYNNIIHGNPGGGVNFWIGSYSNVSIVNNTIYNNQKAALSVNSGKVTNSLFRNNIAYGNPLNAVAGFTMDHNLTTDPGFVDIATGNVQLTANSAAINAGTVDGAPTTDFNGTPRPTTGSVDSGAYQYAGPETTPTETTPTTEPTATATPVPPTATNTPTATPTPMETSLIPNGSFETGLSPWYLLVKNPAQATATTTTAAPQSGQQSAVITVQKNAPNAYTSQFRQDNITLTAGKTYTVTFWAKASKALTIESVLQQANSPYTLYSNNTMSLTTAWKQFSYTYRPTQTVKAFLGFNTGTTVGTVWLDSISLTAR
jgi:parallel beta-helix repeat protein